MESRLVFLAFAVSLAACGSTEAPVAPTPPLDDAPGGWKMVSAGDGQTCGIAKTGLVYCWGKNDRGQLGDGTRTPHSAPARIASDSIFATVSAGALSSCGVTQSGVGYCWGWVASSMQLVPHVMDPQRRFISLAGGTWVICGLMTDSTVYCWPLDVAVGTGSVLPGGLHFQTLANSYNLFCGITTAGAAYCWSADDWGTLTQPALRAIPIGSAKLAVGNRDPYGVSWSHLCTVGPQGAAYCWGENLLGQLGVGDTVARSTPVHISGHSFSDISASGEGTCAVSTDGLAYCWGRLTGHESSSPEAEIPGVRVQTASAGSDHYCFVTAGGASYCGGNNGAGQLGSGSSGGASQPAQKVLDPE